MTLRTLCYLSGRALGALSGSLVSLLWMLALWMPTPGLTITGIAFVVALLMAMMALFVVIASIKGHVVVLLVVFVASFFPVGIHLAAVDHWLRWVAILNLCYLAAAAMMWFGRRGSATPAGAVQ
jgi:hypothetical protein